MTPSDIPSALHRTDIPSFIENAREVRLARDLSYRSDPDLDQPRPERLPRLAMLYESQGLSAYQQWIAHGRENQELEAQVEENFGKALSCWRAISSLSSIILYDPSRHISQIGLEIVNVRAGEPLLSVETTLAFYMAATGLLCRRSSDVRLDLKHYELTRASTEDEWIVQVAIGVFTAFVQLVRKSNGWKDINDALNTVDRLRQHQADFEGTYLTTREDESEQEIAASELVGLYHLAQMITIVGNYLKQGQDSIAQVNQQLDRHRDRAMAAFEYGRTAVTVHTVDLLWAGCRELAWNAIWTHIHAGVGSSLREFARVLAEPSRHNPVIELWPGQQRALRKNILDPVPRAILVQMPTSAGKTLLAQFVILQTLTLNPGSTVAYVVPTRALVSQVARDLRSDFGRLGRAIRVEQTVAAFELDPTEDRFLSEPPDIMVTTPEKLDLLVRRQHRSTHSLSLVVADEAHNLQDTERGARLELLLGMIKRDQVGVRFVLLSPFLPNDEEIVAWLGENQALPPIVAFWRPGRRIVGATYMVGRGASRELVFETLPASANTDIRAGLVIPIAPRPVLFGSNQKKRDITRTTIRALRERGTILVLCRSQAVAAERAQDVAKDSSERSSRDIDRVCRYIEAEVGYPTSLSACIRRGVAYHHAGLSHETRWLIETLVRDGHVRVVCGTTTLAQGLNFPITTVIVETLKKGNARITYEDFWNVAGRAGRTLVDPIGVVAFPAPNALTQDYSTFLRGEAKEISSQLTELLIHADEIAERFDLDTLHEFPQLASLLQFLAHSMRVAGAIDIADEVDDLLRASLVYHQARKRDPVMLRRFMEMCRRYLRHIEGNTGLLILADQTGFTTPSVGSLLGKTRSEREFTEPHNWAPERLFGESLEPLARRIEVIAHLPEMRLGQGNMPPFSPERVAAILRDWVMGASLGELVRKYHAPSASGTVDSHTSEFSRYLFGQLLHRASWGIGALETISLSGQGDANWEEIGYVPSMIFFGVRQKEAIWLRMVGVPRVMANSLAPQWQRQRAGEPKDFGDIRRWVTNLSDRDWHVVGERDGSLTADDMKWLWSQFS
jgi:hypothetical protein